jgi:hypothetical protein
VQGVAQGADQVSKDGEYEGRRGMNCPQCGCETETLHEGYCKDCCDNNQGTLDTHNAQFTRWEHLSEDEKDREIMAAKDAMDMSINEDYEYEKDGGFDHMST